MGRYRPMAPTWTNGPTFGAPGLVCLGDGSLQKTEVTRGFSGRWNVDVVGKSRFFFFVGWFGDLFLGGGSTYVLFSSLLGEMIQFDNMFQMG